MEKKIITLKLNSRIFEVNIDKNITDEDEIMEEAHTQVEEQLGRNNEAVTNVFFEELEIVDTEANDEYRQCSYCVHRHSKSPCPCDSCDQNTPTNLSENEDDLNE